MRAPALAAQYRYCDAHFYDTLRSWSGLRDVKETTRKDWRVSSADNHGLKAGEGAYGHDFSNNDADGWKRSSPAWVEQTFRGGLRDYKGVDVGKDECGRARGMASKKDEKFQKGTDMGNIYRERKQKDRLTTERADEHFLGSLRSAPKQSAEEYQRKRRANLNLPQFRELTPEQLTKAKRVFAAIDLDGSGSIDADELKKFLVGLGHKPTDKGVQKLLSAADEGVKDMKASLKEFARLYHGMKL